MFKKLLLLLVFSAFLATSAFAAVGITEGGAAVGQASQLSLPCDPTAVITLDGFTYNVGCNPNFVMIGIANGGYTSMTTSSLTVPVSYSFVKKAIAASANTGFSTGTLPAGVPGQTLTILITTVGSSGSWTLTPSSSTGWTSIVFNTAGQLVTFLYVNSTVGWIIVEYSGSTLPTINDVGGA